MGYIFPTLLTLLFALVPWWQVGLFWRKAERVVSYKTYIRVEQVKKQMMDKHLDLIVGQTERYSKMLAQNLSQGLVEDGVSFTSCALALLAGVCHNI